MADDLWVRVNRDMAAGNTQAAIATVRLHLKLRPNDCEALNLLGTLLQAAGEHEQSLHHLARLVSAAPGVMAYRNTLANGLFSAGRIAEAITQWELISQMEPSYMLAWLSLAVAYVQVDDTTKAIEAGRRAHALEPTAPGTSANLAFALARAGQLDEAVGITQAGVAANPGELKLHSSLLMLMNYLPIEPGELAKAHNNFGLMVERVAGRSSMDGGTLRDTAAKKPDPARPIRIGILSSDLRDHSVGFFVEPLLLHDASVAAIEVFSTATPSNTDAMTARIRTAVQAWHACAAMSDGAIAKLIRERNIDVLLELGGHSEGNRLGVVARKPAPLIVNAIGYPHSTGMSAMDWRLVDSITDPVGSEALNSERLLRLDPCFLCYTPPSDAPEPAMPSDGSPITFGSFNNAAKIGSQTVEMWAALLKHVPESRLLLKSQTLSDSAGRNWIIEQFRKAGIEASRLELVAYSKSKEEHLRLYQRVHVALDTVPYNGTTTTCEAMWMGVPVVCVRGHRHASRVSASLVSAVGHAEWIAKDAQAFVTIAASLAADAKALTTLRATLRSHMQQSPLVDAAAYSKRFHAAIRKCWGEWCGRRAVQE